LLLLMQQVLQQLGLCVHVCMCMCVYVCVCVCFV